MQKALKMMSPFFNGCPEGGHTGSALCSQKLGRAGIWNMPGTCAIPFPALVSLSHKSHVSSHLFIDWKGLPVCQTGGEVNEGNVTRVDLTVLF